MIRQTLPKTIRESILRNERKRRHIKQGEVKALSYQVDEKTALERVPQPIEWAVRYFNEAITGRTGANTAITKNVLTAALSDNTGTNGIFSATGLTYSSTGHTWTLNEWKDHFLKVDSTYYLIKSNTTGGVLTLDIVQGTFITSATFTIVPFIPDSLIGAFINPDTANNVEFRITANTEDSITIRIYVRERDLNVGDIIQGTVSGAGSTTHFFDTDRSQWPDDEFNLWSVRFVDGPAAGDISAINDFTASTGRFDLKQTLSGTPGVGDKYFISRTLLYVDVGDTWEIYRRHPRVTRSLFDDAADVQLRTIISRNGELRESHLGDDFTGLFSAEIISNRDREFTLPFFTTDSVRIELTDVAEADTVVLVDSLFAPNFATEIPITIKSRIWYRFDIYYHTTKAAVQDDLDLQMDELGPYIVAWRETTPEAPVIDTVSGATSGNSDDFATSFPSGIQIAWTNSIFLGAGGWTEVHSSDTEGGTYTLDIRLDADRESLSIIYPSGTTKWFKLRHVSSSGELSPFTAVRKGNTTPQAAGNTTVEITWEDGSQVEVSPNENGWFSPSTLKAKVTVTTDLTIQDILFAKNLGQISTPENLGSTSPVRGPASGSLDETSAGRIYVRIVLTNGTSTEWLFFEYKYDKTIPVGALTFVSDIVINFEVTITIAYTKQSDFFKFEWHWDVDNSAPATDDTDVMFQNTFKGLHLGMSDYDISNPTLYVWARVRDLAGNVTAWVATTVDLTVIEIQGAYEVVDLMEFALP